MADSTPLSRFKTAAAHSGAGETMRAKPAVLRSLVDFFCLRTDPLPEEIENFSALALELLPETGPSTRMYVAARLARHAGAPGAVLDYLAREDAACRQVLTQHAINLPLAAQIDIAHKGDRRLASLLAARKGLPPEVSAALVQRNDPVVTKAVADNATAVVSRESLRAVAAPGRSDRQLAAALDARSPEPGVDPARFFEASRLDRQRLIASARRAAIGAPHAPVVPDARLIETISGHAMNRDWSSFAEAVARALSIPRELALRMTQDPEGEPLALLLACVGASRENTVRILLFCDEAVSHSYARIQELTDLAADVPPSVAGALVLAMGGVRPRLATNTRPQDNGRRRVERRDTPREQQRHDSATDALRRIQR